MAAFCSICLAEFDFHQSFEKDSYITALRCSHVYHEQCLKKCQFYLGCPQCRKRFNPEFDAFRLHFSVPDKGAVGGSPVPVRSPKRGSTLEELEIDLEEALSALDRAHEQISRLRRGTASNGDASAQNTDDTTVRLHEQLNGASRFVGALNNNDSAASAFPLSPWHPRSVDHETAGSLGRPVTGFRSQASGPAPLRPVRGVALNVNPARPTTAANASTTPLISSNAFTETKYVSHRSSEPFLSGGNKFYDAPSKQLAWRINNSWPNWSPYADARHASDSIHSWCSICDPATSISPSACNGASQMTAAFFDLLSHVVSTAHRDSLALVDQLNSFDLNHNQNWRFWWDVSDRFLSININAAAISISSATNMFNIKRVSGSYADFAVEMREMENGRTPEAVFVPFLLRNESDAPLLVRFEGSLASDATLEYAISVGTRQVHSKKIFFADLTLQPTEAIEAMVGFKRQALCKVLANGEVVLAAAFLVAPVPLNGDRVDLLSPQPSEPSSELVEAFTKVLLLQVTPRKKRELVVVEPLLPEEVQPVNNNIDLISFD